MTQPNETRKRRFFRLQGRRIEVFGRGFDLPASRIARIVIGVLLLIGGCLAFLPVLGVWMIPLGFMVLSIDIAIVRRWRRRTEIWWERRKLRRAAAKAGVDESRRSVRPLTRSPKPHVETSVGVKRL